jgi:hypothetical protein
VLGVILSDQEFTAIQDIQRTTFLFILALNWLVARFVKFNDDKEIKYSQSALFKRIKERVETMCGRLITGLDIFVGGGNKEMMQSKKENLLM